MGRFQVVAMAETRVALVSIQSKNGSNTDNRQTDTRMNRQNICFSN